MSDLVDLERKYYELLYSIKIVVESCAEAGTDISPSVLSRFDKLAALNENARILAVKCYMVIRAQAFVRGYLARKHYHSLKQLQNGLQKDLFKTAKETAMPLKKSPSVEKNHSTKSPKSPKASKSPKSPKATKSPKVVPQNDLQNVIQNMLIKEREFSKTVQSLLEHLVSETHKQIKNNIVDLKGLPLPPIFLILEDLAVFTESFQVDLVSALQSENMASDVISIIELKLAKLSLFSDYSKQLSISMQLLMKMLSNNKDYSAKMDSLVASGDFFPTGISLLNLLIVPARHISDILTFIQSVLNVSFNKLEVEKLVEIFGVVRRLNDLVTMQINRCDERNEVFEWETKYGLPMLSDGQSRDFICHNEGVKITSGGQKQQTGLFSRSSRTKYPHSYTLFSDCVVFAKAQEVLHNIPLKALTVRNPRLHNPLDPRFHLLLTQQNVYDVEFQTAQDCTEFQVKIDRAIEQLERGGIYGKDLRELFVIYNDVPPELRKLAEVLCIPQNAKTEGVFRLSGGNSEVFALKTLIANGSWKNVSIEKFYSIDSIATAFKQFFLELPEPLFTFDLYEPIATMALDESLSNTEKQTKLKEFLNNAPAANRSMIAFLLNILSTIAMYSEFNKMPPKNLAIVFVPSLFSPKFENHEQTLRFSKPLFHLFEGMIERLAIVKAAKAGITLKIDNSTSPRLERTYIPNSSSAHLDNQIDRSDSALRASSSSKQSMSQSNSLNDFLPPPSQRQKNAQPKASSPMSTPKSHRANPPGNQDKTQKLPPPPRVQNPPLGPPNIQKARAQTAIGTDDSSFGSAHHSFIRPPSGDIELIPPPKRTNE